MPTVHTVRVDGVPNRVPTELVLTPLAGGTSYVATSVTVVDATTGLYQAAFSDLPANSYRVTLKQGTTFIGLGYVQTSGTNNEIATAMPSADQLAASSKLNTAAADIATLLLRLTDQRAGVLTTLSQMLTTISSQPAFTATALQLGPNGADSMWTREEIELALEKLSLLSMSQATIVVPSGQYMCGRGDVEHVFGTEAVAKWADVDNTSDTIVIEERIAYAICIADSYIRSCLASSRYIMPSEGDILPAILVDAVATKAGVLLYESKGIADFDANGRAVHALRGHNDKVEALIRGVIVGSVSLSPLKLITESGAPDVYTA